MTDRALSDDDLERLWDEAKDAGGGTWTFARLVEQAALASERAKQAEPVARLLTYKGEGTYPKRGYTAARTYEELPENAYPDSWEEGAKLYAGPPADDEAVRLLRDILLDLDAGANPRPRIDAYLAKVGK